MARALLVGCGCCARSAGGLLLQRGWAVRGSSRGAAGARAIEAAGLEAAVADPDRVGSLIEMLGDVTVLAWLLGSVSGGPGEARRLHGERLPSLLVKLVDTPVRGFVYEPPADAGDELERQGRAVVEDAASRWRIPVAAITQGRASSAAWAQEVADRVEEVVGIGTG